MSLVSCEFWWAKTSVKVSLPRSIGPVVEPVACQIAAALAFCLGIVLAPPEDPSGKTAIEAATAVVLREMDDGRACDLRSGVRWRTGTHAADAQQERSDR
jgi:hypothetical protein